MKQKIAEELRAELTEAIFNHRWELLMGYHSLGKKIIDLGWEPLEAARLMHHRPRDIYYAVELAKRYPDPYDVPDGKNVSWYKITKTLPSYEAYKTQKENKK